MSGIAGVVNHDGRPVDAESLREMTAAAPHRGVDGTTYLVDGPIGMAHQTLRTTPEAQHERLPRRWQPVAGDPSTAFLITFDGRLDNRDELITACGADDHAGDSELVVRAYGRWGDGCPDRLLGDFAFAIWDARRRRLFCARDPLGVRPFYYHADAGSFHWASEIRQLLALPLVARNPDEGMVAEYLAAAIHSVERTLYRGVRRLPPGAAIVVDGGDVRMQRYWTGHPLGDLVYRTDAEYAEHFFELFRKAVAARLRSDRPVGAWLSGGLDSSSVVGMAHEAQCGGARAWVEAFSLVFPGRPETDEHRFIGDVTTMWGMRSERLAPAQPAAGDYWEQAVRRLDVPDYPNDQLGRSVLAAMRARGIRVGLTGFGGDQALAGSLYQYADLLRRGRLWAAARQFRIDRREAAVGATWGDALTCGVGPLMPPVLRRLVRPVVARVRGDVDVPDWIAPGLAHRVDLRERLRPPRLRRRAGSFAAQEACHELTAGGGVMVTETGERESAEYGIEDRHPFLDRRVVEFALAVPDTQRRAGGWTKAVLRRAMRNHLPESVRSRQDKADFTHADLEALAALAALGGSRFLDRLAIASHGWVDQRRVSTMYQQVRRLDAGDDTDGVSGALWMVAAVELWFRTAILNERMPESAGAKRAPVTMPA